ncbi:MAG TPA: helix-turn-helix domain-containing protein [Ktedonobacterales bacterium]|nr:helix-turn-helix domain-containing protein [Ktedonobacterales bacterium]
MAKQTTQRAEDDMPPTLASLRAGGASCTVFQRAIEFIGRRWVGAILYVLLDGSCRFNELLAKVPNISDRLLTERLRELEAAGMLTRDVRPGPPVRVVYELTDAGRALTDVVQSISHWAETWMPDGVD